MGPRQSRLPGDIRLCYCVWYNYLVIVIGENMCLPPTHNVHKPVCHVKRFREATWRAAEYLFKAEMHRGVRCAGWLSCISNLFLIWRVACTAFSRGRALIYHYPHVHLPSLLGDRGSIDGYCLVYVRQLIRIGQYSYCFCIPFASLLLVSQGWIRMQLPII